MRKHRGFSMIESLIAIALVLITGFALISLIPTARKGLQLSENRVNAAYLGRSMLDKTQSPGFANIVPLSGIFEYKGVNNGAPFSQVFNYMTQVQSVDTDKKQIWATVTWKEATGDKQMVIETIVVDPKP